MIRMVNVFSDFMKHSFHWKETVSSMSLKIEQRKAIRQLFERKDLLAVLPKDYGTILISICDYWLREEARRAEARNFACLLVITPLTNIVNDQIVNSRS